MMGGGIGNNNLNDMNDMFSFTDTNSISITNTNINIGDMNNNVNNFNYGLINEEISEEAEALQRIQRLNTERMNKIKEKMEKEIFLKNETRKTASKYMENWVK